uniref:Uncharacterized protein n=1 Tax=Tetranychus urticae TaxID=32264 RepID=T1JT06_TETUR
MLITSQVASKNSCNDECLTKTYCISSDGSSVCSKNNLVTAQFKVIPVFGQYDNLQITLKGYNVAPIDEKTIKVSFDKPHSHPNLNSIYSCYKPSFGSTCAKFDEGNYSVTTGSSYYMDGVLYCIWTFGIDDNIWPYRLDLIGSKYGSISIYDDSMQVTVAEDNSQLPIYHAQYLKCCNKVHGNDQFVLTFDQTDKQIRYRLYYWKEKDDLTQWHCAIFGRSTTYKKGRDLSLNMLMVEVNGDTVYTEKYVTLENSSHLLKNEILCCIKSCGELVRRRYAASNKTLQITYSTKIFQYFMKDKHRIEAQNSCNDECLTKRYCLSSDGSGVCSKNNLVTTQFKAIQVFGKYDYLQIILKGYNAAPDDEKTIKVRIDSDGHSNVYTCYKSSFGSTDARFDRGSYSITTGSSSYMDGVLSCTWTFNNGDSIWPLGADMIKYSSQLIILYNDTPSGTVVKTLVNFQFIMLNILSAAIRKDGRKLQFECTLYADVKGYIIAGIDRFSVEKQLFVVINEEICSWATPFVLGDSRISIDASNSVFDLLVEDDSGIIYAEKGVTLKNSSHSVKLSLFLIAFAVLFQVALIRP